MDDSHPDQANIDPAPESAPIAVSFGFARSTKRAKLEPVAAKLAEEASRDMEQEDGELDMIHTVDRKKIVGSKPTGPKKPLVIPMVSRPPGADGIGTMETDPDSAEALARQALLQEADEYHEMAASTSRLSNLPIILQNQIQGEVDRATDRLDVSRRPDEAGESEYDSVPIEQFGLAMLRGMGWKDGDAAKSSAVEQPKLRPKGLGLGANPILASSAAEIGQTGDGGDGKPKLTMKVGAYVQVSDRKYMGQYGKVESLDIDDARIVVKLALQPRSVSVSLYTVKLVEKLEYDRESKCINKAKYEEYKASRSEQFDQEDQSTVDNIFASNGHAKDSKLDRSESVRKSELADLKASSRINDRPFWIRRDLKVRFVDEQYCDGKYFKQKFVIDDVVDRNICSLRSERGKLLEGIEQCMLETVIPRDLPAYVMVVHGKHTGEVGRLLMRDKARMSGSVQFLREPDVIKELSFDDICQFLGDISAYED